MSDILKEIQQLLANSQITSDLSAALSALCEKRNKQTFSLELQGSWGSLPRLITALLADKSPPPLLYITAHIPSSFQAQDDLETLLARPVQLFPAAEAHETDLNPKSDIASERLRICQQLQKHYPPSSTTHNSQLTTIIVASIQALMQPVPNLKFLQEQSLCLTLNQDLNGPEHLASWLNDHDFERVDQVEFVGEFASRGGIVDIFPPGYELPCRVEFFGDRIESLRQFDLDTQRSVNSLDSITITGCSSFTSPATQTQNITSQLFSYLPADTVIVLEESTEITEVGRIFLDRLIDPTSIYPVKEVLSNIASFNNLYINRFASGLGTESLNLHAQSVQRFENRSQDALDELLNLDPDQEVYLFCEKAAQAQRLREMLGPEKLPQNFHLPVGFVHQGFELPAQRLLVLSHHEIFGQHQPRRRLRKIRTPQAIDSFTDLQTGDLIVHVNHGIGRFRGLKTLNKNNRREEFLALEFADHALIHVPASKIDLVHKYVGCRAARPKLSKLSSRTWQHKKQKVIEAVQDMAAELLDIQAHRQSTPGIGYPPDTIWQREFEESFPYQDTEDQTSVNLEIKKDMQLSRPMDRLLCGDVGYGKTELALRAAFKAVEHGKQVAVLVPTTVLAQQHYRTFNERLADFPFIVEVLSRFKTAKQAQNIIDRTADGKIDILIGTHRLLSPDVEFKDLGLVIIDEEQRFGVEHKDSLVKVRKIVDILTMTATPIPRTLHMALLGIRDISSLTSPPLDRRSIVTEVCPFDKQLIRSVILRELSRDGQVFFLHNRVHNILSVADSIQQLVPEARVLTAHGQMAKHELENCMLDFINHKADILVCTTIIESGLDIPNANTIIINDADRFGLAELHQLRGRVGRYKNRAYAYMLLPARRTLTPTAAKRLKAIEEYSQLGSGFRIALRDLEIRGAGNILGVEQSGHIDAVGYELYCQLLASAVRQHKSEPEPVQTTTHLELNVNCHIPAGYIPADKQRMDLYRRLATCFTAEDLQQLEKDLTDQFGSPPRSVQDLLQLAEIRTLASSLAIRSIVQKEPDLIFTLEDNASVQNIFQNTPGSVRVPDPHTVHLRLTPRHFESTTTLFATLRKILKK